MYLYGLIVQMYILPPTRIRLKSFRRNLIRNGGIISNTVFCSVILSSGSLSRLCIWNIRVQVSQRIFIFGILNVLFFSLNFCLQCSKISRLETFQLPTKHYFQVSKSEDFETSITHFPSSFYQSLKVKYLRIYFLKISVIISVNLPMVSI